jgi:hypothetical protein
MPVRLPAWATDRIEAAVNARIGGARLDIGRVELRFGADGRPEAQLGNVAIHDGAGNPVAQLNALGADFSAAALIGGRLQPRVVELSGAQVTLRRDRRAASPSASAAWGRARTHRARRSR